MLKMMTASLTAMIYFKACHKQLDTSIVVILSFMYGVCGYGMVFYQNIIWLDMMYLFAVTFCFPLNLMVNKGKVFALCNSSCCYSYSQLLHKLYDSGISSSVYGNIRAYAQ